MLNTVALVGKLVDIPVMQTTLGGVKVANATIQIEKGYKNVRIVKDLAGHDRVVIGEL